MIEHNRHFFARWLAPFFPFFNYEPEEINHKGAEGAQRKEE
jgi:hypothetical protein